MHRLSSMLAAVFLLAVSALAQPIPTPDEFAGFPIGSDGNLLRWEKIVRYFDVLAESSDRVQVETLGRTNNGNPYILATISSAENIAHLDEIKRRRRRLARPESLTDEEIEALAWEPPAVVLITCNIHATEIASSQMAVELAHRMATEDSRWMRNVLDNVVFLLVPSQNPDGQIIVVDWNNRIRGTENVWARLPWLYHPYAGHDNNRDAFMMTQPESRYLNKILFQDWFPQVYLDEHQQGNAGMRVFVPPFANPINPNVDPAVWAEAGRAGFSMYQALHDAGFRGVAYSERYTAWWQGGFLRGAWFHNMVGLLSEVAGANLASPVIQLEAELGKPPRNPLSRDEWEERREKDPATPMPPPGDVMPRYNYPRPWLGGKWTLRNVIDAELALTNGLLEFAADNRVRLIRSQIRMGLDAIEAGREEKPWAYVIPPGQHDPGAAWRMLEVLHYCGIDIERALDEFEAGEQRFPAGSYVIRMAQPFRAYAKDLLEPQDHPDPGAMPPGSMADQPYDLTGWTLPIQMGVEAVAVEEAFEARLEMLDAIPPPQGRVEKARGRSAGFLIRPAPNHKAVAVNRLIEAGADVGLASEAFESGGRSFAAGSVWATGLDAASLASIVQDLGIEAFGLADAPAVRITPIRQPRIALYRPWTASMDEGWTRWLLERYEFPFTPVSNADLQQQGLRGLWDAIVLPGDRDDLSLFQGRTGKETPAEFRGGIAKAGRDALRRFVSEGGTLIAMGDSLEFALRTFELPLRNALDGVKRSEFSCPGSFLRTVFDDETPLGYGMPREAAVLFKNNMALEAAPGFSFTELRVVARYAGSDLLQSGWIRGPEKLADRIAAAEVRYKKGRVVLIGFRPQFRAQTHGTFKLLFNALHLAGTSAEAER